MKNHTDTLRKLRDCFFRLSKSSNLEEAIYSVKKYDISALSNKKAAEQNKIEAEEVYNNLIQMSERLTHSIWSTPPWKKVSVDRELCYWYTEEIEMLFYDTWYDHEPGLNISLTKAEFIAEHWQEESSQCDEELWWWQSFCNIQQWICKHWLNKVREENVKQQWYLHNSQLTASLKKLKDWKKYQVYFQREIDQCKKSIEGAQQTVKTIQWKDSEVIMKKEKVYERNNKNWLRTIEIKCK